MAKKKKRNLMNDFFKENRRVSSQIIRQMIAENPKALSLWLGLKDIANGYGICVVSQHALESLLHVHSRMTVYRAVQYLYTRGYIGLGKIGSQNAYILNPSIISRMKYDSSKQILANHGMTFLGEIHLTKSENPQLYKETKKFIKKNSAPNASYSLNNIKHFRSKAQDDRKVKHTKQQKREVKEAAVKAKKQNKVREKQTSLFSKNTDYSAHLAKFGSKKAANKHDNG